MFLLPIPAGDATSNSKGSNQSNEPALWFEWEGDRRKWMAYDWIPNAAIRTAFKNGKTKTKATLSDKEFDIRLDKMVQINCITKWERRIRCLVGDDNGCKFFASCKLANSFLISSLG